MKKHSKGFLRVDGATIVAPGDRPIILKGYAVGNWMMLEHFMIGIPLLEQQIRAAVRSAYGEERAGRFWDEYLESFLSEGDFKVMKDIGANVVRLPCKYRHLESDLSPFKYKKEGFKHLDRVLRLCRRWRAKGGV